MKHAIITVIAIIILHLNSFSQLFDATIDGAVPGNTKDIVRHFEKKGYNVVKDVAYPNDLIFMMGILHSSGKKNTSYPVLLHLTKAERSDQIKSIAVYFTPAAREEFEDHKKLFAKKFGNPTTERTKKAVWQLQDCKYTIGIDPDGLYHEIKTNQTL